MTKKITYTLLLAATAATVFFVNNGGVDEWGSSAYWVPAIPGLIAAILVIFYRRHFVREFQSAIWAVILICLMVGYLYKDYASYYGNRILAALLPGRAIALTTGEGPPAILIHKSSNGHFETPVSVNGRSIFMLVDTGASFVVLSHEDARRSGIKTEELDYSVPISTAAGTSVAAAVILNDVTIGPISRQTVPALISPDGELDQSLLGMSFLASLASFQMKADELRMVDY